MTEVLEHLDGQIRSSRRLLQVLLAQSDSIRRQDVEGVLARLGDIQAELVQRERLERERDDILRAAGARLGVAPDELQLEDLLSLVPPAEAEQARKQSAELRGLLGEVKRVHEQNRILIRQELSFLDHLLRVLSGAPQGGYRPGGFQTAPAHAMSAVDLRA